MKLKFKEFRADYYLFSGKASDIARQLALAGIAVVWIFKVQQGMNLTLPAALLLPALLFVATLGLDLLHYVLAALIWGAFTQWHRSRNVQDDDEVTASGVLNYPALVLFWGKLVAVCIGYAYLFDYMRLVLKTSP
jgi:hypothetical protein